MRFEHQPFLFIFVYDLTNDLLFHFPPLYLSRLTAAVTNHVQQVVSHIPQCPITGIAVSTSDSPIRQMTSAVPFTSA